MFTFGGGYAMISVVENTRVEDKHWITHDDMMNITVIAESTPGPIAIQLRDLCRLLKAGASLCAAVATTGMIPPSFLIIYLVARFLDRLSADHWIAHAFEGIKLACRNTDHRRRNLNAQTDPRPHISHLILACAFAAMLLIDILAFRISSIALLLIAAAVSLVLFTINQNIERRAHNEDLLRVVCGPFEGGAFLLYGADMRRSTLQGRSDVVRVAQ